jgi:glutamate---cysteine ligase / carboxylate-amine ligase
VRTVGVEEELLLFGATRPAPVGEELADEPDTEVEHELKLEQAEIATEPRSDTAELLEDLRRRRRELIDSARERGVRVAALGTSPYPVPPTTTPNERYERLQRHFGLVAREQLSCGLHVHVSIGSQAEGVAAIDAVRTRLPVLVALAANSPSGTARTPGTRATGASRGDASRPPGPPNRSEHPSSTNERSRTSSRWAARSMPA